MLKILSNFFKRSSLSRNTCSKYNLSPLGIIKPNNIYHNLSYEELFNHENKNKEGVYHTKYGKTFGVDTGKFTGRSPNDKWIVKNEDSESNKNLWWGDVNKPISPEVFDELFDKAVKHFNSKEDIYLFDGYCGANEKTRKHVRFVHELSWQQHFVSNMFIRPTSDEKEQLKNNDPDFTIINACSEVNEDWEKHNLNSEVAIAFNIEKKIGVILGTWYGGENTKGIFSLMKLVTS